MTKPGTKANKVWRHNAAIGQTTWSIKALQSMLTLPTLTPESRELISQILTLLGKLRASLATRNDR